jgi:2-polyprenyl-3-methyl-5-hydroxy-6-metoxy-1,4-benzoquinol methylase
MTDATRDKWDARYRDAAAPGSPARVLADNLHLLPTAGTALDLACGLGANALLLAERGLTVSAWDISPVAITRLQALADERGVEVQAEARDVLRQPPAPGSFDVIVVSHFLERALAPALMAALRPGGLLFYQTFTREGAGSRGPSNPAFRLGPNELLQLFTGLRLVLYREEGDIGDPAAGARGEALLIGQRQA